MTFVIITHVSHLKENDDYYAYSPYIREMNIWMKYVDSVVIIAPLNLSNKTAIHYNYNHNNIRFEAINDFNLVNFKSIVKSFFKIPLIVYQIYKVMKIADHIHLRCPGNIGLLGCLVQIIFPNKKKTAKYAGNWDSNSKQPWSYRLQKWILSNTFLTKNMKVLVYGEWQNQTRNIKPFFTASYQKSEIEIFPAKEFTSKIKFLFVGTLSIGKRPLYAIQIVEKLKEKGYDVQLELFGEGILHQKLEDYCETNNLNSFVFFKGNQTKQTIKIAYQENHFLLLPSKSEGWPKVVAEAMFWKCLPIVSNVSCVSNMLNNEERGILLSMNLDDDMDKIDKLVTNHFEYILKVESAQKWSHIYTIDKFEEEIKLLLQE